VREEFNEENRFCKKSPTGQEDRNSSIEFPKRLFPANRSHVDMIATGTDVKPSNACSLCGRKSRNYFEQMKGRGTRVFDLTS